jgi:hypothetical protein
MRKFIIRGIIFILCLLISTNCATIIHSTTQNIDIRSDPADAEIWIDGAKLVETTPTTLTLERKNAYFVKIIKGGYEPTEIKIERKTSGWIIGNILLGGLIGCGIDFLSGGAYDLTPESLDVNLTKIQAYHGETIMIPEESLENLKKIRILDIEGTPVFVATIDWKN